MRGGGEVLGWDKGAHGGGGTCVGCMGVSSGVSWCWGRVKAKRMAAADASAPHMRHNCGMLQHAVVFPWLLEPHSRSNVKQRAVTEVATFDSFRMFMSSTDSVEPSTKTAYCTSPFWGLSPPQHHHSLPLSPVRMPSVGAWVALSSGFITMHTRGRSETRRV